MKERMLAASRVLLFHPQLLAFFSVTDFPAYSDTGYSDTVSGKINFDLGLGVSKLFHVFSVVLTANDVSSICFRDERKTSASAANEIGKVALETWFCL